MPEVPSCYTPLEPAWLPGSMDEKSGTLMRLGDYIDDHCSRCKRTTDHAIVAMSGEEAVKVLCRTCNFEHKYRGNKSGKKELTKEEAFQKVLASVTGQLGVSSSESAGPARKKKSK